MANKLKDMELTSVDLCKRGANPMADIKLFKSADSQEKGGRSMNQNENGLFQRFLSRVEKAVKEAQNTTITKADSAADLHTMTQAVEKSIQSIIADDSLSAVEKSEMMAESLQHFTMDATEGIQKWSRATGVFKDEDDGPDDDDKYSEYVAPSPKNHLNSHIIIYGASGSGKTTTTMKTMKTKTAGKTARQ